MKYGNRKRKIKKAKKKMNMTACIVVYCHWNMKYEKKRFFRYEKNESSLYKKLKFSVRKYDNKRKIIKLYDEFDSVHKKEKENRFFSYWVKKYKFDFGL